MAWKGSGVRFPSAPLLFSRRSTPFAPSQWTRSGAFRLRGGVLAEPLVDRGEVVGDHGGVADEAVERDALEHHVSVLRNEVGQLRTAERAVARDQHDVAAGASVEVGLRSDGVHVLEALAQRRQLGPSELK